MTNLLREIICESTKCCESLQKYICVMSRYEQYDEYSIFDVFFNTDYASFCGAICLIKSYVSEATKIALALVKLSPARERKMRLILLMVYHTAGSYLSLNQGRFPVVHVKESEL